MAETPVSDPKPSGALRPETIPVPANGPFPNASCPVVVYRRALSPGAGPAAFERLFEENGWTGSWRNGIYGFDHFHTTAHEVLGIAAGRVEVGLGGPGGPTTQLESGDVVVLPAGVAHRNDAASPDLLVVGAYADGRDADLRRGEPSELQQACAAIARVPAPRTDPVLGTDGPLPQLWTPVPEAPPGVA